MCCAAFRERKRGFLWGGIGDRIRVDWFSFGNLELLVSHGGKAGWWHTVSAGDSAHAVRRGYKDAADPARAVAARARDYRRSVELPHAKSTTYVIEDSRTSHGECVGSGEVLTLAEGEV